MTTTMNAYDALYNNLKNSFTVIYNGSECTVGDFMLMKANKHSESTLPMATSYAKTASLTNIVEYVNDKLTVKKAPVKDRTMRNFPLRTSLSSLLSASAACALVLSCGIFALTGKPISMPHTAEANNSVYEEVVDVNDTAEDENYIVTEENKN